MIYTDGVHLVADTLSELHNAAKYIGCGRHRFHGMRKGHPHYDITKQQYCRMLLSNFDFMRVNSKKVLEISKN